MSSEQHFQTHIQNGGRADGAPHGLSFPGLLRNSPSSEFEPTATQRFAAMELGQEIKLNRLLRGLSQEALGRALDCDYCAIMAIEAGDVFGLTLAHLVALSHHLCIDPSRLLKRFSAVLVSPVPVGFGS